MRVLARAASGLNQDCGCPSPFHLAFLTDSTRIGNPDEIIDALPPGAAVIFRDYDVADRHQKAAITADLCRQRGLLFYLAGDPALAATLGADGVHLPSALAHKLDARPSQKLVSVACHDPADIARARQLKADSVFLSPVYATKSHPGAPFLGREKFLQLASSAEMPVVALGGVNAMNAETLRGQNVCGFGAIGAFLPEQ